MASRDTVLDELLARVRVLEDKTQLASLMNRYCIAADARDRVTQGKCFTEDISFHTAWGVFRGRAGRSIATKYVRAATAADAPPPAPYPVQRGLTAAMRTDAQRTGDVERMQAWAGQSVRLGRAEPAGKVVQDIWDGARKLLGWNDNASA